MFFAPWIVQKKMYDDVYRIETCTFDDPVFVDVPVSYLITMHDSARRASYLAQLRRHRPTATVHIVHNPGRRHPGKPAWVDSTARDLWHVNRAIVHWTRHLDAPVLILEDDVQFTDAFTHRNARRVERLLREQPRAVYFLGCVPFLAIDGAEHMRLVYGGAAHAVICTAAARARMATAVPRLLHDLWYPTAFRCYVARHPLAVQTHPRTDNMRHWDKTGLFGLILHLLRADTDGHAFYRGAHAFGRMSLPLLVGSLTLVVMLMC
jgi:hypothetical protein